MKEIYSVLFPIIFISVSSQLVLLVERILASHTGAGGIAGLNYAYKLAQFPVWTFASAASVVTFPLMSRFYNKDNIGSLNSVLNNGIRLIVFVNLPLSVVIFVLRYPLVELLFKHGAFGDYSVNVTVSILTGYSLSIVAQSVNYPLARSFYTIGKFGTVLFITGVVSCFTIAAEIILVNYLGAAGIGYGAAFGAAINTLLLTLWLLREIDFQPAGLLPSLGPMAAACIPLVLVLHSFQDILPDKIVSHGANEFIRFLLIAGVGAATYLFACLLLKVEEARLFWVNVQRVFK